MVEAEKRILTLHPKGKKGVNILESKYNLVKDTLIQILRSQGGEMSYQELNAIAKEILSGKFHGSITWYVVSVKLDLEARGIITRIPKTSPHRVKLIEA